MRAQGPRCGSGQRVSAIARCCTPRSHGAKYRARAALRASPGDRPDVAAAAFQGRAGLGRGHAAEGEQQGRIEQAAGDADQQDGDLLGVDGPSRMWPAAPPAAAGSATASARTRPGRRRPASPGSILPDARAEGRQMSSRQSADRPSAATLIQEAAAVAAAMPGKPIGEEQRHAQRDVHRHRDQRVVHRPAGIAAGEEGRLQDLDQHEGRQAPAVVEQQRRPWSPRRRP